MNAHTKSMIVFSVIAIAILFALPAQAQDDTHANYIPMVSTAERTWFGDGDLWCEMVAAGYDPSQAAQHTWCVLHEIAQPPTLIVYSECTQNVTEDGSVTVVYWFNRNAMHHTTISTAQGE